MSTTKKKISNTLLDILHHHAIKHIRDRSSDIENVINEVSLYWTHDLLNRKPAPAEYLDGDITKACGLDMATFLFSLWDRNAVINLPEYKSKRPKTTHNGQYVISNQNRHGKILGLTSNQSVFTFGIRILDQNIVSSEDTGYCRTYLVTDFDGNLYEGWKDIIFIPSIEENKFLTENKLWDSNIIHFDHFVTPEKWISFYGQYYFITKCLINRLAEESKCLNSKIKHILDTGITYPLKTGEGSIPKFAKSTAKGNKIEVECFNVEIDIPEYINDYTYNDMKDNQDNLVYLTDKLKNIRKSLEKFRFVTRMVEFAISKMGIEHFPAWLNNIEWEKDFKFKGKRIKWNRLKLFQPEPFKTSVCIRCRYFKKMEFTNDSDKIYFPQYEDSLCEGMASIRKMH